MGASQWGLEWICQVSAQQMGVAWFLAQLKPLACVWMVKLVGFAMLEIV